MTSAAFSVPHDPRRRISIRHRVKSTQTVTSTAADEALQQVLGRRALKREGRLPRAPKANALTAAMADLELGRWLFRSVVLAAVGGVLTAAVVSLNQSGPPVPVHDVKAYVVVGHTVPVGAQVVLHPRLGSLPDEAVPQGTVKEDGTVEFFTYPPLPGVPAGDYVATVQWFRVSKDGSVGGNVLPARYASPSKSPLEVSVAAGANELPPLQITAK